MKLPIEKFKHATYLFSIILTWSFFLSGCSDYESEYPDDEEKGLAIYGCENNLTFQQVFENQLERSSIPTSMSLGCAKLMINDDGKTTYTDLEIAAVGSINGNADQFLMDISAINSVPESINAPIFSAIFYSKTSKWKEKCRIYDDGEIRVFEGSGDINYEKPWEIVKDDTTEEETLTFSCSAGMDKGFLGDRYFSGIPNPRNRFDSTCGSGEYEKCNIGTIEASIKYKIHDAGSENPSTVLAINMGGIMHKLEQLDDGTFVVGGKTIEFRLYFLLHTSFTPSYW